jgi:hypothetical protein
MLKVGVQQEKPLDEVTGYENSTEMCPLRGRGQVILSSL